MKKIVSSVLSQLLSRYIDYIDESQLEIELWNGKCQLENVKIAENALSSHYIPLIVQKGVLDKINLIFPWSRLKSEPCEINIENIFILATINGTTLIYKDLSSKNKSKSLEALDSSMESGSSLTAFNSIIDNLRVNLKNIHLRIEIPIKDHYIALGIMFSNIFIYTVDEHNQLYFTPNSATTIYKRAEVENFTIYLDPETSSFCGDNFSNLMLNSMKENHHNILNPFSFEINLNH